MSLREESGVTRSAQDGGGELLEVAVANGLSAAAVGYLQSGTSAAAGGIRARQWRPRIHGP